jgi:tRNA(fMet)-specific endonuclease VapC
LDDFIAANVVISCELETARIYGEIKLQLHHAGQLIPDNDLWIAALAIQHQLTLVTRDKHCSRIDRLDVEAW